MKQASTVEDHALPASRAKMRMIQMDRQRNNAKNSSKGSAEETDCLEENTRYMGANIPKKSMKKNIESAEDCQQKCHENPKCLFFTWNSDKNQCILKKEKG